MKNILKKFIPIILTISLIFSFSSCSSNVEITEQSVTDTVFAVQNALMGFDTKELKKYVDSPTLEMIMKYADKHDQFQELGHQIFKNLDMVIQDIDIENQTVTVFVINRDLSVATREYMSNLKLKYSSMALLDKLDNEEFLDESLAEITTAIDAAQYNKNTTITLKIEKGKKNLVLSFDNIAEDAVSGGVLTAIKTMG